MSKTPRVDANCFRATTEKPSSGDYELEVVYAEFARKLELENEALNRALLKIIEVQESCAIEYTEEDWIAVRKLVRR